MRSLTFDPDDIPGEILVTIHDDGTVALAIRATTDHADPWGPPSFPTSDSEADQMQRREKLQYLFAEWGES